MYKVGWTRHVACSPDYWFWNIPAYTRIEYLCPLRRFSSRARWMGSTTVDTLLRCTPTISAPRTWWRWTRSLVARLCCLSSDERSWEPTNTYRSSLWQTNASTCLSMWWRKYHSPRTPWSTGEHHGRSIPKWVGLEGCLEAKFWRNVVTNYKSFKLDAIL